MKLVNDKRWGDGTSMKNLRPTVQQLIRFGVKVRTSGSGKRLHAKIMIADNVMSIGSCNWTENSQSQTDRLAILRLSGREAARETAVVEGLFASGEEWDLHRPTPSKSKSHDDLEND